jgi:hypothetical protein
MPKPKWTEQQMNTALQQVAAAKGLDVVAFNLWIEYRRQRKPEILPISYPALIRKFQKLGPHQAAAVEHSMAEGYQGLFLPRDLQEQHEAGPYDGPSASW